MRQSKIILLAPIGMVFCIAVIILLILIPEPDETQTYYFSALVIIGTILTFIGLSSKVLGSD